MHIIYRSREEQREAGVQYQRTPWLSAAGLAELQRNTDRVALANDVDHIRNTDQSLNVQLGMVAHSMDALKSELVLEYDSDTDASVCNCRFGFSWPAIKYPTPCAD